METVSDTFKSKTSLDFYEILEKEGGTNKKPLLEVYPSFRVKRSKDLMIRGKQFYAIWDQEKGLWSTDEFDVQRLIDKDIASYEVTTTGFYDTYRKYLGNFSTNSWLQYRNYVGHLDNHYHQLDDHLTFKNSEVRKEDYVTKRLPYDLSPGDISAWDEVVSTLYDEEERQKIEWMIGSIVAGDSKTIQKFVIFYGAPGTGKGTIINIIQMLFDGYWEAFNAKELTSASNAFALEAFKMNPLLAIDHDGDLSKIADNTKFNSMVSHEPIQINEKNKPIYTSRFDTFFIIGSNSSVKFTDSKSGLIRRTIDIRPSTRLLPPRKYQSLMNQIKFELGAIAHHCHQVYLSMGKDYYAGYRPIEMMLQTDVFFNFIEAHYDLFRDQNGATLKQAFDLWKLWLKETEIEWKMPQYRFREELSNYFEEFEERGTDAQGERVRSYYSGFKADKFKSPTGKTEPQHMFSLVMEETESLLDKVLAKQDAQYSNAQGNPILYWDDSERSRYNKQTAKYESFIPEPDSIVSTKLRDLDTTKEHYVKVPKNLIVIDFDLQGKDGKKSAERNLEAASTWPATYAEFSKSGEGIHLHYYWDGDVTELAKNYDDGIEVKVYSGNSALRRRLTLCNNVEIATINSGLPLKEKTVIDVQQLQDEKHVRALINKALRKGVHPGTKSNVDFIHKTLEDAYKQGLVYDVTDMRNKIFSFASLSTNQPLAAMKLVQDMKFASEARLEEAAETPESFKSERSLNADREVLFDVEVFPNLFVICWMYKDAPQDSIVTMINPTAQEVEKLLGMKLVGFNNRRYDNHILYAAYLGFDLAQLYKKSQDIINNVPGALFGEAFNLSYMDLYDIATKKQGLKKWEIELGIHHLELGLPWDQPVDKSLWDKVGEYCRNDVWATNITRNHLEADVIARQILTELSDLPMNATTNSHTTKIIFGDERKPQDKFVYTDLSEMFPGYEFNKFGNKSTYRDEITGEGGYVYAEPGMYENVAVLDVASMHPTSIEQLDLFGEYTKQFSTIKTARVAIKRKDKDKVTELLGEKISRYLDDPQMAKALSDALKIAINSVYGLTSARFDNPFKDPRNIDNIVAKRGALFMVDLKHAVQEQGFQVVHIKTDSIKIPNATPEIIQFVMDFGAKYGYDFEHEETYRKMCLVNDAVFIAQKSDGKWSATGAQFQHPYVFKRLFSREEITFNDMCETKTVQSSLFLDYTGLDDTPMALVGNLNENNMKFVGKAGQFCPMIPGTGGGVLVREKDGKFYAATGTKGWEWMESEMVENLGKEQDIEVKYFERLVNEAIKTIEKFTTDQMPFEWFVDSSIKESVAA